MDMLIRYPLTRRKGRCIHSYSSQGSDPIYFAQSPCLIPDGRTSFEAARVAEDTPAKTLTEPESKQFLEHASAHQVK